MDQFQEIMGKVVRGPERVDNPGQSDMVDFHLRPFGQERVLPVFAFDDLAHSLLDGLPGQSAVAVTGRFEEVPMPGKPPMQVLLAERVVRVPDAGHLPVSHAMKNAAGPVSRVLEHGDNPVV